MLGMGLLLLIADFRSLVHRKITELMGIGWAVIALLMIIISLVPGLSDWSLLMNHSEYLAGFLMFHILIINAFFVCTQIAQLSMKNRELAMQVSLLNQENERILHELELLTGKNKPYM